MSLQFEKDGRVPEKFEQGDELGVLSLSSWLSGGKTTINHLDLWKFDTILKIEYVYDSLIDQMMAL